MVILRDSKGRLEFSNYERRIKVETSTSFPGIAFKQSTYQKAWLEIGNYGRRLQVEISASFPFINEDSLTF
jgi:hypothetical protein